MRLLVRQQPARAQVVQENNPKNRKPIDPPPIIELKYDDVRDPVHREWLVSPRTFMMVTLVACKDSGAAQEELMPGKHLIGQTVSSLHRLKDVTNKGELLVRNCMLRSSALTTSADGGFFVFGDISAKKVGTYKLRFSLFDTQKFVRRSCKVRCALLIGENSDSEDVVYMAGIDSDPFPGELRTTQARSAMVNISNVMQYYHRETLAACQSQHT